MSAAIISDHACKLGEGPTYDPATGTLWWFDIVERKLLEKQMPDGATVIHDLPFMASALATIDADRQLVVGDDGFYVRERAGGRLTLHTPLEADKPGTRSNDSRVHPSGSMWAGTMALTDGDKGGAIYWFRAGEVRLLYPDILIPNSICFSPDGSIAYFTDTMKGILLRVACDPATGLPAGEPAIFIDHRGKHGGLDGSVVDADGNLWNARWGAGAVDQYDANGNLLRTCAVPARQSTCPAFVGRDLSRIAVTSAWKGMDDAARKADPHGGKTFLLDVTVNGRAEPNVLV